MNKATYVLLLLAVAAAAALAGFTTWMMTTGDRLDGAPVNTSMMIRQEGPLTVLPQSRPVSPFSLTDHRGQPFGPAELEGRWSVLFFGFTSCPHICPDTMQQLDFAAEVWRGRLPAERQPQVVFVAVDPERDTPEKLSEYVARFDPEFVGVRGDHGSLRSLVRDMGAHYAIPEHEPGEWYNVDHTSGLVLVAPDGGMRGVLSAPHDGQAIGEAIANLIDG